MSGIQQFIEVASQWTIPLAILTVIVWAKVRGVDMYESFIVGAKEGFGVAVMIMPYLVAILFVIKVFLAGGLFEDVKDVLAYGLGKVGMSEAAQTLDLMPLRSPSRSAGGVAQACWSRSSKPTAPIADWEKRPA